MKHITMVLFLLLVTSNLYGQIDIVAQGNYLAEMSRISMDSIRSMQFIEDSRRKFLAKLGRERIQAGRANTTFTNDPRFSLKQFLLEKVDAPTNKDDARTKAETKKLLEQNTENALRGFYDSMAQNGYQKNDFVDGVTMIFALNTRAYIGQEVPKQFLAEQNAAIRKELLINEVFQGWNDKDRQIFIERNGALAIYAVTLRQQSERTNNAQSGTQSRQIAQDVFLSLFDRVPDNKMLEAIAKGEKVNLADQSPAGKTNGKKSGNFQLPGAKTTYVYNDQIDTARSLASRGTDHSPEEFRQYLQLFYSEVARRGGQKNDMAFVGAMIISANYYVVSDGRELTQQQFQGTVKLLTDLILSSENLQRASDTEKQTAIEGLAIETVFGFLEFRNAKGALMKGGPDEKYPSQQKISLSRRSAEDYLKLLFATLGEDWSKYYLTPDGFIK